MLSLEFIREHSELVAEGARNKGVPQAAERVEELLQADQEHRQTLHELESQRSEMNRAAKSIGQLMSQGQTAEAEAAKAEAARLKQLLPELEAKAEGLQARVQELLVQLPNLPHESVPVGHSEAGNAVVREQGEPPRLPGGAQPHWELAARLGLIDFERGAKLTGAGFPVYTGWGARLQRALVNFFLDRAREAGYQEVEPPFLVNEASAFGTGQLPDKEGQMYVTQREGFYLIPTSEVPLTNLHREEILSPDELPLRYCAFSPCFRREAGSHGQHVRGLNRLHQFDKVEIVEIVAPATSYERLEAMTAYVSQLLEELNLPFRQLVLCTGDSTFAAAKTYDLEVYSAAQERWLEVSSVSNFEAYQANRLKLRHRVAGEKKPRPCHTLNGSALALPRVLAALLENGQQADGRIGLPAALVPYAGTETIG